MRENFREGLVIQGKGWLEHMFMVEEEKCWTNKSCSFWMFSSLIGKSGTGGLETHSVLGIHTVIGVMVVGCCL